MNNAKLSSCAVWEFSLAIIFFLLFIVAFSISKASSFLWLNQYHNFSGDIFFQTITLLGDGWFSIIAAIVLFFIVRKSLGIQVLVAYLSSGLLAQIIKNTTRLPRPKAFFSSGDYQFFIEGVSHVGWNSFPSGHTTSVFALATVLSLNTKNLFLRTIYIIVAFIVGYSRIYLGQHFLPDVICGAALGCVTGVLVFRYIKLSIFFKPLSTQAGV